jgi:hypothetical protein
MCRRRVKAPLPTSHDAQDNDPRIRHAVSWKARLQGVALDSGEALNQIAARAANWSPDTIRAIQARLRKGGYYTGAVDGRGSARLNAALKQWRSVGSLDLTQGG